MSTNPKSAQRRGAWVRLDEVGRVWGGVVGIIRDCGCRRRRGGARLKFLVADWGVDRVRETIERDYLGRRLDPLPVTAVSTPLTDDHVGATTQRDDRLAR